MTSATNVAYHVANLLEKMSSSDKDYRFMATNDLMMELQKDNITLDEDSERKVVKMLLKLLEDKNGEVQNLAVKCLGPVVNKVKEGQVEMIVDSLCINMIGDSEQLRDVSCIALKQVINALPTHSHGGAVTGNVIGRVTPRLTSAIAGDVKQADVSVMLEILDILSDLLLRYGGQLTEFHAKVEEVLLPQLSSNRLAVRKRAIVALAHLVIVCEQPLFSHIMGYLINELIVNRSTSTTKTYVSAVACVCRSTANSRFAEYLPQVIPLLLKFCGPPYDDDELREAVLQALEAFVYRCPREMDPYISEIVNLCSRLLTHDPNYHYDDDNRGDDDNGLQNGSMDTGGLDDEPDEEEDEYSDDDDVSWKVRRAAAKCLESLICSRRDQLGDFYARIGALLIGRFKEREENVKSDVFHAYVALLRQTKLVLPSSAPTSISQAAPLDPSRVARSESMSSSQKDIFSELRDQLPLLVKSINRQLREKSLKTRQCCFTLLTELLKVHPGALAEYMSMIVPGVTVSMTDRLANSNTKIDTLCFLEHALSSHSPQVFYPYLDAIIPLVTKSVKDPFYKVSAEALAVIQALVGVLARPNEEMKSADFDTHIHALYDAVAQKLKATDIDQEVKEKAIAATGLLIGVFGDTLQDELPQCLPILLDRLRNEMTRLTTVKALNTISLSNRRVDLTLIMEETLVLLAAFLRKNQRTLKIATLTLLESLTTSQLVASNDEMPLAAVLTEIPALIADTDLQICQLALKYVTHLLWLSPAVVQPVLADLLAQFVQLLKSPLVHGNTLVAALHFIDAVTQQQISTNEDFQGLVDGITAAISAPGASNQLSRQAYLNIAKSAATVVAARHNSKDAQEMATKLAQWIQKSNSQNASTQASSTGVAGDAAAFGHDSTLSSHHFALLTLGEIGRRCPAVFAEESSIKPEKLVLDSFLAPTEEIKAAASYALGGLAVGNLEKFLPFLLHEIEQQPKRQYLLLHALKEVIGSESVDQRTIGFFKPHVASIWKVLAEHASCGDEGTRNVVAECLGKLCLLDPEVLLPRLKGHLYQEASNVTETANLRATVVTAVKYMVVDQPLPIDDLLKQCIGEFLSTLQDKELNVRRVALVTFNSTAHNKPKLVRDLLDELLPHLYKETKVNKSLIREVEMGPFKHTVDDGLDLRKAAFDCMYTLLDSCLERLDIFEFISHIEEGLKDQHDIKLLAYLMLGRLAQVCPAQVLQRINRLVEPIKQTLIYKVKSNAVKQEAERQEELRRSAIRAVLALGRIPDSEKQAPLIDLHNTIRSTPELNSLYQSLEKDLYMSASFRQSPVSLGLVEHEQMDRS